MKGMWWNCEGLGDTTKHYFIHEMKKEHRFDFIILLKIGSSNFVVPFLNHLYIHYCLPPHGRSSGILVDTSKLARATLVYTIAQQQILKKLSRDPHVDKSQSISRFLLASIPGDTPPQPIC
jgi:hypothetical protein